eukprot:gene9676-21229_t
MPTVSVDRDGLYARLGRSYTEDEFQMLCFDFGIELDEVTSEKEMVAKEQGEDAAKGMSDDVIYKIDIPANRYDMLCMEGIARALRVFLELEKAPEFKLKEPASGREKLIITEATQAVRPYAVAAVLRGVTFDPIRYKSFIDLQEKLHENICRKRELVAIGTHDLDTIKFKPLRASDMSKEYTAEELMEDYEANDKQLKKYLPIIRDAPKYPVIRDSNGVVLSMPPIINSDHSKISVGTKNVFIECTANDRTKASVVLNMMVCMFSEYCAVPFEIEPVDVVRPGGETLTFPDLSPRYETVPAELVNRRIGINCWAPKLARLLTKMMLSAEVADDGEHLRVEIPATRSDVIHQCDIWEDCAISYGYNNIEWIEPKVATNGYQQPVNKLTDQLRGVVAQAGYLEVLTFALCSHADGFSNLRREDDGRTACVISNPANAEFQIPRINLLSGLLNTIKENKSKAMPIRIFEVADVVLLDSEDEVGAVNRRRLGALIYSPSPKFEEIQGLLDYVMRLLGVSRCSASASAEEKEGCYYVTESHDPAFFGDLAAADIIYKGERIGVMGVVHPEVLTNFSLDNPCGALELELEAFL